MILEFALALFAHSVRSSDYTRSVQAYAQIAGVDQ